MPSPPLCSSIDEAQWWSERASPYELEAYATHCFLKLSEAQQRDCAKYEQIHSEVNTHEGITIDGHQFLTGCELLGNNYEPLSYIYIYIYIKPASTLPRNVSWATQDR